MTIRPTAARAVLLCALWFNVATVVSSPAADSGNSTLSSKAIEGVQRNLRAALLKVQQNDTPEADTALRAVIDAPEFASLDTSQQHAALSIGADSAMHLGKPLQAQQLAIRATALPEQSIDDWNIRWRAAAKLGDAREEVNCATVIGRRWGRALTDNRDGLIFRALDAAKTARLDRERLEMLQLLFDLRWVVNGAEPSEPWRELTLLLLEKDSTTEAGAVAVHVTDPYQLIAMRADNRYRQVFKLPFVQSSVRRASSDEIEAFRTAAKRQPRSLARIKNLVTALLYSRKDQEVLQLTDDVIRQVDAAASASMPYDDVKWYYGWVLGLRAFALVHLGRYDDAVAARRRAMTWPGATDAAYQAVSLAALFCDMDRPREALSSLPSMEQDNVLLKARIALTRLIAAVELSDDAAADAALAYLRAHEEDYPRDLQVAEAVAGHREEAVKVLLSRLRDPRLRSDALLELQDYASDPAPPRAMQWSAALKGIRDRPEVRAAIAQVGRIDHYSLISKWY